MYRIGLGYDVHQLTLGRKLILAGVEVPHELGLEGHSDADVLTHAVMDSLLGALASAPRSESITAWVKTSASECPSSPSS